MLCGFDHNDIVHKHSIWNLSKIFGLSLHNNKNCQNVSVFLQSNNHLSINQSSLINQGYNTTLSECVTKGLSGEDPCSCFMVTSVFCLYWIVVISLALQEPKLVGAMTNLRPCKGKDEAKLAAKQRTKCLNQMRACNGYVEKVLPTFENWNNNFLIISISISGGSSAVYL